MGSPRRLTVDVWSLRDQLEGERDDPQLIENIRVHHCECPPGDATGVQFVHPSPIRFGMADVEDELLSVDERAAPLSAIASRELRFLDEYDFGDDWRHEIHAERVDSVRREGARAHR